MNTLKKMLFTKTLAGLLIAVMMLVAAVPGGKSVKAEETIGGGDGGVIWKLDPDGFLEVEVTGNRSAESAGWPWADLKENIKKVKVSGSGITDIADMFEGCSLLTEADLSSLDLSSAEIGEDAFVYGIFTGCDSLTSVKTPSKLPEERIELGFDMAFCSSSGALRRFIEDENDIYTRVICATGLKLSRNSLNLRQWECKKLEAEVTPTDAFKTEVRWFSYDESVAKVDENGKVKAVGVGKTIIQANSVMRVPMLDNNNLFDICEVTVTESDIKPVTMYRLYNPNSGEHFYTSDKDEIAAITKAGWRDEGFAWEAPDKSDTPVYRLYNPNAGDHHYTISEAEKESLVKVGWSYEGIGWYSDDCESVPLYRFYNPNAVTGAHHYSTNEAEKKILINAGWKDEGIAWYGIDTGGND